METKKYDKKNVIKMEEERKGLQRDREFFLM